MNLNFWSENLVKEIYDEYKTKYSFWKPGLKVFYSPISIKPKLAIIGFQPGGGESHYINEDKKSFESGDFSLPVRNVFLTTDYRMAKRMRDLFDFDAGMHILEKTVTFPLIFFRAPSVSIWNKEIPKNIRKEMEDYSISKVKIILADIKPEKILILGLDTYKRFIENFGPAKNEKILHSRSNGSKMSISSIVGKYSVFVIIHPTGARISNIDWQIIKSLFKKWI